MESLPLDVFSAIVERLTASDINELSATSKTMNEQLRNCIYKRTFPVNAFRLGTWFGTWDNEHLYFVNGPIQTIHVTQVISCVSEWNDYSRVTLKLRVTLEDYHAFYHHPYYASLRYWIRYFFNLKTQFYIRIHVQMPSPNRFQFKSYHVLTTRRKRDHCNAIGITIGFHNYPPLFPQEKYHFSQRVGFHWDMCERISIWDDARPVKFILVSDINISNLFYLEKENENGEGTTTNPIDSYYSTVDFKMSATKCLVVASFSPHTEKMETFYTFLELYANTFYSLLKDVDYNTLRKETELKRIELSEKFYIPVEEIIIDAPKTLDDVWNLLQTMEIQFRF